MDLGMTKARELFTSIQHVLVEQSLYMSKSVSLVMWTLPLSSLLEMCLQKGSVHCICSKASHRSAVNDFGVGLLS